MSADTYDVYIGSNGTVKLVDFNPVGGTTAPLLFEDWGQLGYNLAATAPLGATDARPSGGDSAATELGGGLEAGPEAASTSGVHQQQQRQDTQRAANGAANAASAAASERLAAADLDGGGNEGSCGVNDAGGVHLNGHTATTGGPPSLPEIDFRIITEPVRKLHTSQCAVSLALPEHIMTGLRERSFG